MTDLKFIGVNYPTPAVPKQANPSTDRLLINTIGSVGGVGAPLTILPFSPISGSNPVFTVSNGSVSVLSVDGSGTLTFGTSWSNGANRSWSNSIVLNPPTAPSFGIDGLVYISLGSGLNPSTGSGTDGTGNPPKGSLLLQTDGTAWIKTGVGATAWAQLATSGAVSLLGDVTGSTSSTVVERLRGGPIDPSISPSVGHVLAWDGFQWISSPTPTATYLLSGVGTWAVPVGSVVGDVLYATGVANNAGRGDNAALSTALPVVGIVASKPTAVTATVAMAGELSVFAGLTSGATYFLGNSGGLTSTPPLASGTVIRRIGHAKNTTTLILDIGEPIVN